MKHIAFALAIALSTAIASSGCATFKGKENSQSKEESKEEKLPFLTRPEVKTLWVPDTIEGNRYIEGHRVFVIDKNSSWSKDQ